MKNFETRSKQPKKSNVYPSRTESLVELTDFDFLGILRVDCVL